MSAAQASLSAGEPSSSRAKGKGKPARISKTAARSYLKKVGVRRAGLVAEDGAGRAPVVRAGSREGPSQGRAIKRRRAAPKPWTPGEDALLIAKYDEAMGRFGTPRWIKFIMPHFSGRNVVHVKGHYHGTLKKRLDRGGVTEETEPHSNQQVDSPAALESDEASDDDKLESPSRLQDRSPAPEPPEPERLEALLMPKEPDQASTESTVAATPSLALPTALQPSQWSAADLEELADMVALCADQENVTPAEWAEIGQALGRTKFECALQHRRRARAA